MKFLKNQQEDSLHLCHRVSELATQFCCLGNTKYRREKKYIEQKTSPTNIVDLTANDISPKKIVKWSWN